MRRWTTGRKSSRTKGIANHVVQRLKLWKSGSVLALPTRAILCLMRLDFLSAYRFPLSPPCASSAVARREISSKVRCVASKSLGGKLEKFDWAVSLTLALSP